MGFSTKLLLACGLFYSVASYGHDHPQEKVKAKAGPVIPIDTVKVFEMNGNKLQGLATKSHGAKEHEVWRTSIAPGSKTPRHVHSSEETFVILKGEGIVVVGKEKVPFKAPCTVIAPAGVPHQVINTGKKPTEAIVIVGIDSEIRSAKNEVMNLPWRH